MITKDYILCGKGHKKHPGATFTLEIPKEFQNKYKTNPHYTYKIKYFNEKWFAYLLTGPDNTSSYTYLGEVNEETGEFRLTEKSRFTDNPWSVRFLKRVFYVLWHNKTKDITKNKFDLHHLGRCGRCGRPLTTPESVSTGIGPLCAGRI